MNSQTIPVINASELRSDASMRALDAACRDWGIFQVVEHGISSHLTQDLLRVTTEFFHQPSAIKREISRSLKNHWGFFDKELTKNIRDQKEVYDYGPEQDSILTPQWPAALPEFKKTILSSYSAFEQLAFNLLEAMVANLDETMEQVMPQFEPQHTSFLRLNYYPTRQEQSIPLSANKPAAGQLGINPHTDAGALTVLLQDQVSGLEVFKNGSWHKMLANEEALLINIGDVMQVWSNDRYQAPLHRVLTEANKERFSAPFFLNPAYQAQYQPLPATVSTDNPPRYSPINWKDFREKRAAGDYADYGEEVQISHYRI